MNAYVVLTKITLCVFGIGSGLLHLIAIVVITDGKCNFSNTIIW